MSTVRGFDEVQAGTETSVPIPDKRLFPSYGSAKFTAQTMVLNANGQELSNG